MRNRGGSQQRGASRIYAVAKQSLAIPGLVDTRRRVSPLLSRITVSLALVLGPSRGNPCQGPTIGRSSSHLINNPPTMSTPSDSQLINDRRAASQCRRWPLRDPACSADRWFTRGTEVGLIVDHEQSASLGNLYRRVEPRIVINLHGTLIDVAKIVFTLSFSLRRAQQIVEQRANVIFRLAEIVYPRQIYSAVVSLTTIWFCQLCKYF